MAPPHRKKPFSGKKKKVQLQERRERRAQNRQKMEDEDVGETVPATQDGGRDRYGDYTGKVFSVNRQPQQRGGGRSNRYNLEFCKDKLDAEFERSKKEMYEPIVVAEEGALEYSSEQFFPPGLKFPERPEGYQTMTKETLEMLESKSVRIFGEEMRERFGSDDINLYEQNTETWRQLWRVMDKSDVLLFIVDCRFAVCQFPPYVYKRLEQQGRGVVLVLNKVDMMPAPLVLAWQRYFERLCPGMQVVPFCSHERIQDRRRKVQLALQSCRGLLRAVKAVAKSSVDLSSWEQQLDSEAAEALEDRPDSPDLPRRGGCRVPDTDEEEEDASEEDEVSDQEQGEEEEEEDDAGGERGVKTFTVGTIGYPNVGKSSLINAILGQRKVSVSHTPGHTKHFQTHYLTHDRSVMLCDCPGLIFPAVCPYKLQVLSGTFPVAQVRAPMAVVGFLAAHINVPRALGITLTQEYREDCGDQWTPFYISEAWAVKRNYKIKGRGGRPDASRAANELVRLSLAGRQRLVLCLTPPGYSPDKFEGDSAAVEAIRQVQGIHAADVEQQQLLLQYARVATSGNSGGRRGGCPSEMTDEDDENASVSKEEAQIPVTTVSKNKFAVLNLLSDENDSEESETDDDCES